MLPPPLITTTSPSLSPNNRLPTHQPDPNPNPNPPALLSSRLLTSHSAPKPCTYTLPRNRPPIHHTPAHLTYLAPLRLPPPPPSPPPLRLLGTACILHKLHTLQEAAERAARYMHPDHNRQKTQITEAERTLQSFGLSHGRQDPIVEGPVEMLQAREDGLGSMGPRQFPWTRS